jgi:hypothetical protein
LKASIGGLISCCVVEVLVVANTLYSTVWADAAKDATKKAMPEISKRELNTIQILHIAVDT